jgi:hypothetical protein
MGKVLFLHGMFGQNSSKPYFIRSLGLEVFHPLLNDWSFEDSIKEAQKHLNETEPDLIVGSSRGGAVAMNIDSKNIPIILLAPAWRFFGKKDQTKNNSTIIHSENDNLIPIKDSIKLAANSNCKLVIAGKDHRLNCEDGKNTIKKIINTYLNC